MTARSAASPAKARALAEACFAVARSATFAGERDNAISRGTAIASAHGLDLDGFDIPGRAPAPRRRPAPRVYDFAALAEAMGRFNKHMSEATRAAAADDASRRAQEAEMLARATVELLQRMADAAAEGLWAAGYTAYRGADAADGSRRWVVFTPHGETDFGEVDDDRLMRIAAAAPAARRAMIRECHARALDPRLIDVLSREGFGR